MGVRVVSQSTKIELWLANSEVSPDDTPQPPICVYDAENMTNLVAAYSCFDPFTVIESTDGHFVVSQLGNLEDFGFDSHSQVFIRIPELHSAYCNAVNNLNFASPRDTSFNFSIAANTSGSCLYTIILPIVYSNFYIDDGFLRPLAGLYIKKLNYTGNSTVAVVSILYGPFRWFNDADYSLLSSTTIFEFSAETSNLWSGFGVFGSLIEFVVPAGGQLEVDYEGRSPLNLTEYDVAEHSLGIIQSLFYPVAAFDQDFHNTIRCSKGVARINITIVLADIPHGGYMKITGGGQSLEYKNSLKNKAIVIEAESVVIEYNTGEAEALAKGERASLFHFYRVSLKGEAIFSCNFLVLFCNLEKK